MPIDHFAVLGLPRRPWLSSDRLKERFHQLTASGHPDVGGDAQAFAAINAAYATLREPAQLLRHFLELEAPEALVGAGASIPPALVDRFMEIATLRRATDAFVKQQSMAITPLARALLASERFTLHRDVENVQAELETLRARDHESLEREDAGWDARTDEAISRLAAIQQELTYLERWSAQLREALLQLESGA